MTTATQRHPRQAPKRAPRPPGVRVRRQWSRTRRNAHRLAKRIRESFTRGYAGVERMPHWRRTWQNKFWIALVTILGLLLLAWIGRATWIVVTGHPVEWPAWLNPDDACRNTGYSCGIASGVVMSFLTVSFAGAVFFWLRLGRVRRAVARRAQDEPRELVETAGTIFGHVVGRDELCNVIVDDLRDRAHRRPHVVLGGVGVGKTAVILELTKRLAEHGAVPVPISLRDADQSLDFSMLAQARFMRELRRVARSDADAERAWRELRNADQIVVLADGLEEALPEKGGDDYMGRGDLGSTERDNQIRVGFRAAQRERLPLVVASRPHDALVGLDAAVVELEPLGEESALEYIETGASTHDQHRLDWVIETADVTETPLFLQLARELHAVGLLENALPDSDEDRFDTRGQDRIGLRVKLLETWVRALEDGYFHRDIPFSKPLRQATIAQLGVLACAGLVNDSVEVRFADVFEPRTDEPAGGGQAIQSEERYRYPALLKALRTAVEDLYATREYAGRKASGDHVIFRELRLAATRGVRLRLAEARGHGVRFPHSIMQAYLASRVLPTILEHPGDKYLQDALTAPNREFLTALTMQSRAVRSHRPRADGAASGRGEKIVQALEDAVRGQVAARAIDVVVAAMEVDSVQRACRHRDLAEKLEDVWPAESEDRTVEDAKLKAVRRFGEAARHVGRRARLEPGANLRPAYAALYAIARKDLWYPVRIAAAQELGRGGDEVLVQLGGDRPLVSLGPFLEDDLARPGGDDAGEADQEPPRRYEGTGWRTDEGHRELAVRGWVAPMFVSSVKNKGDAARANLETWLRYVGADDDGRASRLPISLEIALAQGFKHAANRRLGRSRAENEARGYLAERAVEMLEHARFWFSRLTLVQALCLWVLSDPELLERRLAPPANGSRRLHRRPAKEPERRGSDPAALIDHWLASAAGGHEHPFVAEARDLAVLALEKRQPERYLWIDESGVVSKIGSRPPLPGARRKHNLWIPPSTGWSALHPRAQRLVGDVLILLNLIERGDSPVARETRLRRALRDDLPSCLADTRAYLDPHKTVGAVEIPPPGARCKDGCAFDLCPYPPKGPSQTYRVELSEAFCRRQQVLIGFQPWPFRQRTAPWQGAVPSELKRFWMEMEARARL